MVEELAAAFEARRPGTEVTLNLGSSGELSRQVLAGAPADVVAFADTGPMDALVDAGLLVGRPRVFATNRPALVTPADDPAGITSIDDLASARTVSLCVASAPCGEVAAELLAAAGVVVPESSVTRGRDVRATLAAVTEGDADAAIVYVTDAAVAAGRVRVVDVPEASSITTSYPIAAVSAGGEPEAATAFVDFVRSDEGRVLLLDAGFGPP